MPALVSCLFGITARSPFVNTFSRSTARGKSFTYMVVCNTVIHNSSTHCTVERKRHPVCRIKGWWISHHFISCFCSGVLLIWYKTVSPCYACRLHFSRVLVFHWLISIEKSVCNVM